MAMAFRLWAVLLLASFASATAAQGKPDGAGANVPAGLAPVLAELQKGGLVIYFRHAATDVSAGVSDKNADLARCETQRNLSARGREQAAAVGKAIRALRIPVGAVFSSAFCRCKDTAQLAFGRYSVDNNLYFAIGVGAEERAKLTQGLKQMLFTVPAAGTNTIIVSHSANLQEAAGIWPKPEGVAYVFRPLPGNRFEPLAMILPEDWTADADPSPAGKR